MRQRVNWFNILQDLDNKELYDRFFELFGKLRHGRSMSCNRCAYYVLKTYYSTTTIDDLVKKVGDKL